MWRHLLADNLVSFRVAPHFKCAALPRARAAYLPSFLHRRNTLPCYWSPLPGVGVSWLVDGDDHFSIPFQGASAINSCHSYGGRSQQKSMTDSGNRNSNMHGGRQAIQTDARSTNSRLGPRTKSRPISRPGDKLDSKAEARAREKKNVAARRHVRSSSRQRTFRDCHLLLPAAKEQRFVVNGEARNKGRQLYSQTHQVR